MGSDLEITGRKTELLLDICIKTKADSLVVGMGGSSVYLDRDFLLSKDIKCVPQNFKHPVYSQYFGGFIPNLSIIDLLFNKGKDSIKLVKNSNL